MSENKNVDLFSDNRAFELMTAAVDETAVSLSPSKVDRSTKGIHTALLAAGMTPGLGNIADVADATLYALEGEFGEAAWSMASAIPVIGQMVSGKRALKAAKEAGEEMVTVYRGLPQWYPGHMVDGGKFISPEKYYRYGEKFQSPFGKGIWVTNKKHVGIDHREFPELQRPILENPLRETFKSQRKVMLEFEVPKSWLFEKSAHTKKLEKLLPKRVQGFHGNTRGRVIDLEYITDDPRAGWFVTGGIPKEFLKKVHK